MAYDDSIYDNLPDDPELAFLHLEEAFDAECRAAVSNLHPDENVNIHYVQYISKVLGTIQELELTSKFDPDDIPDIGTITYNTYLSFSKDVQHYKARLKIRTARRKKQYSVALDPAAKAKLRHLLTQMKSTIDTLDVSAAKKEALHAKISALETEIDRNRTGFEVIGALWVESCAKIGEGVEKLEPLRKWLDPIGILISQAKNDEPQQSPQLPAPKFPRRLEPPKGKPSPSDIDDDIPF